MQLRLQQRIREGCFILVLAVSIFLWVALFSYHRADPGWSHTVSTAQVSNAGGRIGAWFADFFLYLLGYLAYLFPVLLTYTAGLFYFPYRESSEQVIQWPLFFLRMLGFLFIVSLGPALIAVHLTPPSSSALPFAAGGILGTELSQAMLMGFNLTGSTLLAIALLLIGITLFTGLSWLRVSEVLGVLMIKLSLKCYQYSRLINWKKVINLKWVTTPPASPPRRSHSQRPKIEPDIHLESGVDDPALLQDLPPLRTPSPVLAHYAQDVASEVLPPLSLLDEPYHDPKTAYNEQQLHERSREVELCLADFGVEAKVVAVHPGPVVTRYELELAAGTKVSKVNNLVKDLARSLSVLSVRVVEVIPGKSVIGLELPNEHREIVYLREVLGSKQYQHSRSYLTLALGKDIAGHPVIVDLAKMPHLLVAGTTGSGKSVSLNAMLLSLLYKSTPQQLRLILIDPKMLELSIYQGIPHLLTPVVTDMREAATALRWCVAEMERRYHIMARLGVRNIAGYNLKIKEAREQGTSLLDALSSDEPVEWQELPFIVVLADEFADMMVVVGKKIETLIARLAQKARAAGIHLIFATQRPSVDVITGLIKANISTRIAFQTSSKVDSRTILDQQGAEQLLGHGDMLYLAPGTGLPVRVHGTYAHDEEVHRVAQYLKIYGQPDYVEGILDADLGGDPATYGESLLGLDEGDGENDPLYDQAVEVVVRSRRISISSIQRRFKIGYIVTHGFERQWR